MKKSYLGTAAFLCALIVSAPTLAQYSGPQKAAQLTTVASAAKAADGTYVMLDGQIISKLRKEHYSFQDATGTIEIEIDAKYFPVNVTINEKTKVRIHGKVDKDFAKDATVDVKQVDLL